jgi:hypothetical protein
VRRAAIKRSSKLCPRLPMPILKEIAWMAVIPVLSIIERMPAAARGVLRLRMAQGEVRGESHHQCSPESHDKDPAGGERPRVVAIAQPAAVWSRQPKQSPGVRWRRIAGGRVSVIVGLLNLFNHS